MIASLLHERNGHVNGVANGPDTAPTAAPNDPADQKNSETGLGSLADDILELLEREGRPLKAATIALKLGRKPNSHFRQAVYDLCKWGYVEKNADNRYAFTKGQQDEAELPVVPPVKNDPPTTPDLLARVAEFLAGLAPLSPGFRLAIDSTALRVVVERPSGELGKPPPAPGAAEEKCGDSDAVALLYREGKPLKMTVIASRLGLAPDYLRKKLYRLVSEGVLSRDDDNRYYPVAKQSDPAAAPTCRHSEDYRSVTWHGRQYSFTKTQAGAVKLLWESWEQGIPEVSHEFVLKASGSDGVRIVDVFRRHPAWGEMIVSGRTRGTYRLAGDATCEAPRQVPTSPLADDQPPTPALRKPVGCSRDILETLRKVNRRLTTPGVLREMANLGYEWAESTVKQTLSVLVDNGEIDNRQDTNPRGYGLPGWEIDRPADKPADKAAKAESPGEEKIRQMAERAARGEPLFSP